MEQYCSQTLLIKCSKWHLLVRKQASTSRITLTGMFLMCSNFFTTYHIELVQNMHIWYQFNIQHSRYDPTCKTPIGLSACKFKFLMPLVHRVQSTYQKTFYSVVGW